MRRHIDHRRGGTRLLRAALAALVTAPLVLAGAVRPAAAQPDETLAELHIDALEPRVVVEDGDQLLRITGTLTNTSDRSIAEISVRAQRGEPLRTTDETLASLRGGSETNSGSSEFMPVASPLDSGESTEFTVSVPVSGADGLQISEPGVYPLLMNVNGMPDYGNQARIATADLLLPVLGVPGGASAEPSVQPATTLIWPLADEPRVIRNGADGETVLTDDELASSLVGDGRLAMLLNAMSDSVPPASELSRSICFAVDPDLLVTVDAMQDGYQVRSGTGELVDGVGAAAAGVWLHRLRDVAQGRCLVAMPYADADLVALSRADRPDLIELALDRGATVVEEVVGTRPMENLVWPADGVLDEQTLDTLVEAGVTSTLLHPRSLAEAPPQLTSTSVQTTVETETPPVAIQLDPLVGDVLAGSTTTGWRPQSMVAAAGSTVPPGVRDPLQDVLSMLAFRAIGDSSAAPATRMVIAPPRRWQPEAEDLSILIGELGRLFESGLAVPAPLAEGLDAPEGTSALSYPPEAGAAELQPSVSAEVSRAATLVQEFESAMSADPSVPPESRTEPVDLVQPVELGLLRGMSSSLRGNEQAAMNVVNRAVDELSRLRDRVQVNDPGIPLSLAASDSPLPLSVTNDLPVDIRVQVTLENSPGLRAASVQEFAVPAHNSRAIRVPAEVSRSGQFTTDVALRTPDGTELGSPVRFVVMSTAYGTLTLILTIVAGATLILLVTYRLVRRIRAGRAGGPVDTEDANARKPPEGAEESAGSESDRGPSESGTSSDTDDARPDGSDAHESDARGSDADGSAAPRSHSDGSAADESDTKGLDTEGLDTGGSAEETSDGRHQGRSADAGSSVSRPSEPGSAGVHSADATSSDPQASDAASADSAAANEDESRSTTETWLSAERAGVGSDEPGTRRGATSGKRSGE
ncbi:MULTISPECIES: DUF6049 family protein [Actinoalloteichus]|uniref:Glycoprotein n=1 Tax=Actinoalloteichus fjordicus TaxID=1612552 RepID=A0AAC9PVP3_9PSEU|nr:MULTISPECIES: DUF6049 family protein [Actinoalloteichus]APU18036.1 hypothetical protein UA74_30225 [Actinoalloteichus fjordicus]APU24115.1 hypothetical protein UA75_30760 [Actinoalloteichus sp. GBA129-24]